MRVGRVVLVVLAFVMAIGGSVSPAVAQDEGVGFDDLTGLQLALGRTFASPESEDIQDPPPLDGLREIAQPELIMWLTVVWSFDTEANAASGFDQLRNDMNATGFDGMPLTMEPIPVPLDLNYAAALATDETAGESIDFTIVMAQRGTVIYSVIAITRGPVPDVEAASVIRQMASSPVSQDPMTFSPDGTSTGSLWGLFPTSGSIEPEVRGEFGVTDEVLFEL